MSARVQPDDIVSAIVLIEGVSSGCKRLAENKQELNDINVFPIPDADTGNNMAAAAKTILNELSALNASSSSVSRVIRTISQACVSGGRGNSGTLLTHFFAGLVEELESRLHNVADDKTVSVADMSLSLKGSGARMMEAYENAQEGTIVSVLRDSTAAANDGMHNSWTSFTSSWLSHARRLLERTPEDLVVDGEKILKTHFKGKSVVDSGAAGVVYLIEGIDMAASGSPCTFNIVSSDASTLTADSSGMLLTSAAAEHVNESLEGGGRYCTECIFSVNDNTTQQNIQQRIGSMGDSVVVVVAPGVETNSKYAKLHIHTNEPAEVFAAAECIANDNKLLKEKCEDMRGQVDCNNYPLPDDANRSVALVIYSSNDLPETLAQRMQLQRVCCFIYVNDVEMMDRREMNQDEFLCMLRHDDPVCKTAAPTKQMYIDAFSRAFDQLEQQHQQRAGDRVNEVLHLGPSRSLSEACWANSHAAAEALEPAERRGRVVIHDCRGISGIEAVLTLKAYELACQGKTAAEIVAALEDIRDRTNCLVAIPTLKYLQRGGRVNTSIATIGKLINLKIIMRLSDDGTLTPAAKVALCGAYNKARRKALSLIRQHVPLDAKVMFLVVHCGLPAMVRFAEDYLRATYKNITFMSTMILGSGIACHSGPEAFGIVYYYDQL